MTRAGSTEPYWLGWEVPFSIPDEDMLEEWPEGMKGWCSAEGHDYMTFVGLVYADSPEAAQTIMLSCYPGYESEIRDRWAPHEADVDGLIGCGRWGGIETFVEARS